ncbi:MULTISPECIES: autotransporter outer membrane beta-barrel domain-containing protein [Bordetella]|uniref:Autotransporter domain-containing protein n=3 Tax=Bordetella TaxID=517 RepID=K0M810_BORPB|nr:MULTISPECIES: autotransporter outer membrane beta-barrel domain-containing protein [Bordetella]AMG86918.1 autotransporter domain-containing protein [Bordetella bronchiseptica]AZW10787.1 autotransporter domain-containing protein [Bordetella bronchiseptica]QBS67376.1 autotransporter outer membrane beta-barrel domain-containing protein [Bordetella bronchiseptica]CAE30838.1 hypothetical protein BB0340 [Bordetella bronchiseptica RB50]CCJ47667.1 hypothetical protein BN117_0334 [Bordetella paraper
MSLHPVVCLDRSRRGPGDFPLLSMTAVAMRRGVSALLGVAGTLALAAPAWAQARQDAASAAHPTWMAAAGNWQVLEGGPGVARVKQRTTGVYAGSEHALGAGLRLGGVLGLTRSTARVDDLHAKGHVNSYSLALYGARTVAAGAGDFNAVAGAAYTWHDMDTRRHFHWAGTSQTLTADTHGSTFQAFGELGYRWRASARVQIEPFAALAWRDVRTRAFVESGGWAAISAGPSRLTQTTTTLGVRGEAGYMLGPAPGKLRLTLGWRRAFGDVDPQATLVLDGGNALAATGAPIARDAVLAGLGAELALSRSAAIGLAYIGQYGGGNREHTGSLSLRWLFGA